MKETIMKISHLSLIGTLTLSGAATLHGLGCETHVNVVEPAVDKDYVCALEDVGNPLPEARCQSTVDPALDRHGQCVGGRSWAPNNETSVSGDCTVYAMCLYTCQSDADCPVPPTGTAQPTCRPENQRYCRLGCDNGETCPDGLTCIAVNPSEVATPPYHQCMTVFHTEADWSHDLYGSGFGGAPPDVCPVP
jgi:hypothetical protein